ncbi:MAG TPA: hypothetical protein VF613_16375 [Longimicrobium sp.]|jgi:hypothetical protein
MAYREFVDGGGVSWRAWDTYPGSAANVRPGFESGWLGFECEQERRRLAPVPPGWETASDDELRSMLADAQPNRPARLAAPAPEPEAPAALAAEADKPSRSNPVLERVRSVLRAVDHTLRG